MDSGPSNAGESFGKADGIEVESTICHSVAPEGSEHEPAETAGEYSFSPPVSMEECVAAKDLRGCLTVTPCV